MLPILHRVDDLPGSEIANQLRQGDRIVRPGDAFGCNQATSEAFAVFIAIWTC